MGLRSSNSMSLQGLQLQCIVGALELLCLLSLMHGALAQDNNCSLATFLPLSPCLGYIQPGNTSIPDSVCCSALNSTLTTVAPSCICQLGSIARQSNLPFNITRALDVASSCNQTVPANIISCLSSGATPPLGSEPVGAPSATPSSVTSPPPQSGSESPKNHGSALLPPSLPLISGSIFVALFLHLGVIST